MKLIKNLYFKWAFFSLIIVLFLVAIEGICSLLFPTSRLDQITDILVEDENLFWVHKSNLNGQLFQGEKISTDEDGFRANKNAPKWEGSKVRIAVMGASPSFGWGVKDDETYSAILQQLIQVHCSDKNNVSIINASQIGYSSYQGLNLLKEKVLVKKPTHIILTYVINDLDYFRFFRNSHHADKDVPHEDDWKIRSRNFLRNLKTYKVMEGFLQVLVKKSVTIGAVNLIPRVELNDYEKNIEAIIQLAKTNKIVPILLKFPVNLPRTDMTAVEVEDQIQEALKNHNTDNEKRWKALLIAKRSVEYNKVMDDLARKHGLELIDIVQIFRKEREYLFIDPSLDPIHPNRRGHELMAEAIFEDLRPILCQK